MAATYSPTMQRSTIGDAVCVGGSAASLPPLRHAPLSLALALSARLCRAPLPRLPLCARLRLSPAPLMHFFQPHDHLSLMGYNSKVFSTFTSVLYGLSFNAVFPLVTSVFIIGLSL